VAKTFVIFDTNCILCSGFVRFILKNERNQDIHFVKAWSKAGTRFAVEHGYTAEDLQKTFLIVTGEEARIKSNAFFEIAKFPHHPPLATRRGL